MFPRLTVIQKSKFQDLGLFSESLLFYQNTNLILDPGSLPQFLETLGYENAIELLNSPDLDIQINSKALGGGNLRDNIYMISSWASTTLTKDVIIERTVDKLYGKSIESNGRIIELKKLLGDHQYSKKFIDLLNSEISNKDNLVDAISLLTNNEWNKENINIEIEQTKEGFYNIESNVSNKIVNDACFHICVTSGKIYNSYQYESELTTNDKTQFIPNRRIDRIINKRLNTEKQISNFHEFVLPNFYDLNSTMNSGTHTVDEFMELWRTSQNFKSWLKDEEPNVELLTAYLNEIGKTSFLSKLPVKTIRWLLFTGAGLAIGGDVGGIAGTAASTGIDLFDDLVLDGLIKKQYWKPNMFVKGDYNGFLNFELDR